MTFKVDGANGLTFPNSSTQAIAGLTTTNPQSGGVVQTVNAVSYTIDTTTSSSYTNTSLTASITPKFSSSKILILISGVFGFSGAGSGYNFTWGILRGSTQIYDPPNMSAINTPVAQQWYPGAMSFLDSPATTSSTTYTLNFHTQTGTSGSSVKFSNGGITLLEIAA